MKKIFLFFLFTGLYKVCTAQEIKISDEWNFLGIVSKIISNNKLSNDTIITKLNAIRIYEKRGDTLKITTEETRYIVKNECWSRIKITGTLNNPSSEKAIPSKDSISISKPNPEDASSPNPKNSTNTKGTIDSSSMEITNPNKTVSTNEKINLQLINSGQKKKKENTKGIINIYISVPFSISQNLPASKVFHTFPKNCEITSENFKTIQADLNSVGEIDLVASDNNIFSNTVDFITFEDDLRTPSAQIAQPSSRQRRKLLVALNYTPQVSFDRVLIDEASFNDQSEVDRRAQQSRAIYGYNTGLSVGWWVNNNNRFSLNFAHTQMGFESKNSTIDWTTGYLYKESTTSNLYHFRFWQADINYAYVDNNLKKVNAIVDIGLSVNWKKHLFQNNADIVNDSGFKKAVLAGNLGVGANINIAKWLDLELVPNIAYSFTPVHTSYLKTHLWSAGITSRFVFNFFNK